MPDDSIALDSLWEAIQQKETYPIFRLTYLSHPVKPFTDADFDDIESKSVQANNARDVTGLLIVNGDRILQIIEGREDAVRDLYAKIEADDRHTITKVVSEIEGEERFLLTWSMVVRKMTGTPPDVLSEYAQLYDEFSNAESQTETTSEHIDLFKAISLFEALP
ncbi:BLUF domain-containing protein [Akkermansiaceae bacterium]|nr:BLUF domain-containing protein [Akkermansiaceae bacterium]MDB4541272.1 BLUF domain-containing protein [Akkermansiaceae bacterium]